MERNTSYPHREKFFQTGIQKDWKEDFSEGGGEIDLGELMWKLLRGWKVIFLAGLIGAVVGVGVIWIAPSRYEAKLPLSVASAEELSPVAQVALGATKPSLELLQEYANQILSPAVLERAAEELAENFAGTQPLTAEQLRCLVTVSPLKDEGRLMVSVVMADSEWAKTALSAIVQYGTEEIDQFRTRQQEALQKYGQARVASAQRAYQEAQKVLSQLQKDQKYIEKNARLREANRRVELLQQMLTANETELAKLQTRIRTWEALLPNLSAAATQAFRLEGTPSFTKFLAEKWGLPEKQLAELKFVWEQPSELRQEVEKNLLQDRATLEALQTAQASAQKTLPQSLAELDQAQADMDALNASLAIAQWELSTARTRYTAAQEALAKWETNFNQTFPVVSRPSASSIRVQPKGLSSAKRWIAIEILALGVGAAAVFLLDAIRQRGGKISAPTQPTFPPLTPDEEEMLAAKKISA